MQSQLPIIVHHPPTERWILHASAFGIFLAAGWLISKVAPSVDEIIVTLLATFVAFLVWFVLDYWITRRKGLTVRFDWSARGHRLRFRVYQQFKTLVSVRMDVADYYGNESLMHSMEVKEAIIDELISIADVIKASRELHIIGIDHEDSGIFVRLVTQALERELLNCVTAAHEGG